MPPLRSPETIRIAADLHIQRLNLELHASGLSGFLAELTRVVSSFLGELNSQRLDIGK